MILIGAMGSLLVLLGFLIGSALEPGQGGVVGAIAALGVWGLLLFIALAGGDQALLLGARAKQVSKQDLPRLWNVVEEMTIASGLNVMPRIYVIDDNTPNAFAAGARPDKAVLAVNTGLVKRLNRDELQGVIAHEIGHIRNLDARFLTIAAVLVASITIVADMFLRGFRYGAGMRRIPRLPLPVQLGILAGAAVVALLAPFLAQMLYLACSREREYLADASAARFTRYPEGLASALEKIALAPPPPASVNRALAPLYTVNPIRGLAGAGLTSTHPPTEERIRILRGMAGGAGYVDYEKAYRKIVGGRGGIIGKRTLSVEEGVPSRQPSPEAEDRADRLEIIRQLDALLGRLGSLLLLSCACGVQIRVPPSLERDSVQCPRCGRQHAVPRASLPEAVPAASAPGGPGAPVPPAPMETGAPPTGSSLAPVPPRSRLLRYERRNNGWESFRCACGKALQLSPAFDAPSMHCPSCRMEIEIVPKGR